MHLVFTSYLFCKRTYILSYHKFCFIMISEQNLSHSLVLNLPRKTEFESENNNAKNDSTKVFFV